MFANEKPNNGTMFRKTHPNKDAKEQTTGGLSCTLSSTKQRLQSRIPQGLGACCLCQCVARLVPLLPPWPPHPKINMRQQCENPSAPFRSLPPPNRQPLPPALRPTPEIPGSRAVSSRVARLCSLEGDASCRIQTRGKSRGQTEANGRANWPSGFVSQIGWAKLREKWKNEQNLKWIPACAGEPCQKTSFLLMVDFQSPPSPPPKKRFKPWPGGRAPTLSSRRAPVDDEWT